ncbi:type II toxin-antitoxin system death-on-curing family toxin [Shouchella shacheensis]|uniref:type II toxin-antitoxin system death-on-curing family toxin n=1 Tax=Shouchella shacheensis TaxID=1649580 RepID=UPI0007404498|nr:type II toxin-antitoxin system death-on-curing family toxin [Shouchella shacheensis]
MEKVDLLSKREIVTLHYLIMEKYGEGEDSGVKEEGLLESAIARPEQSAFGEEMYISLYEKSAVLFESIARNHCFFNGNKRTALAVLDIALQRNGYNLLQNDAVVEDFTVDVAQGKLSVEEIVRWIKEHSERI